jgi:hypothetical protein
LAVHDYTLFASNTWTSESQWVSQFKGEVGTYADRTVCTEWGGPMSPGSKSGVSYDSLDYSKPSTNYFEAYVRGVSSQLHAWNMGSFYWAGLKDGDWYSMTTRTGTGSSLTLSVPNQSGLAQLQNAWTGPAPSGAGGNGGVGGANAGSAGSPTGSAGSVGAGGSGTAGSSEIGGATATGGGSGALGVGGAAAGGPAGVAGASVTSGGMTDAAGGSSANGGPGGPFAAGSDNSSGCSCAIARESNRESGPPALLLGGLGLFTASRLRRRSRPQEL